MNDATFLLDESLTKLTDIHNIQNEMDNVAEWNKQTQVIQQLFNYYFLNIFFNQNNIIKLLAISSRA